uniref:Icc protein n=1 Tax=Candidatus Kentrum sp. FW TaxID=2126338 RepID=A0A450U031_9GAMM|nr:MAG: Icc protein [Candidatus Kentron sp. FW]
MTKNLPDNTQDIQVIQITDLHLLVHGHDRLKGITTWQTFEAVMEKITHEDPKPDLVLVTGDLVHDGPVAVYRRLRTRMDLIDAPVYVLPGNHDDPALLAGTFGIDAKTDKMDAADPIDFGYATPGNWLIVFLNSVVPGEVYGVLAPEEIDRLDRLLGDHAGCHALLCLHHHPVSRRFGDPDFLAVLRNAEVFFSIIDRHPNVRGIVWGHIHDAFEGQRKEVRLLGTPSTCFQFDSTLKRVSPDDGPPAYRRLTLKPDGVIESEVVEVPIQPGSPGSSLPD